MYICCFKLIKFIAKIIPDMLSFNLRELFKIQCTQHSKINERGKWHKVAVPIWCYDKRKQIQKRKLWQKIIICVLLVILIIVLGFSALIGYLTLTEFNPDKEVPLKLTRKSQTEAVYKSKELTAVSWNIGYGALGSDADFFMDGGKSVDTADKDGVNKNLKGISSELNSLNPDFILLQEVDTDAKRSSYINEASKLQSELLNQDYQSSFAENFKVKFIPYPIPPIGKVNAGIMTLSKSKISEATRVQLPCPFKWPTRVANLKRCLSINRLPIEGSDKELVIVNLHLEAYDDGDGKKRRRRCCENTFRRRLIRVTML